MMASAGLELIVEEFLANSTSQASFTREFIQIRSHSRAMNGVWGIAKSRTLAANLSKPNLNLSSQSRFDLLDSSGRVRPLIHSLAAEKKVLGSRKIMIVP